MTGDLRVIENARMPGPKYREPNRVNWKATKTMFFKSIDLYVKNWSKREQVDLKYLPEWKDHLKELVTDHISNLKGHFKSPKCKILDQLDVKDTLHKLHANYVLVPADKAANHVIILCKKYYIDTLVKELGINNVNISNPLHIHIDYSFKTIMKSQNQFITSVGLETSEKDQNLPYLYWTPKLHKSDYLDLTFIIDIVGKLSTQLYDKCDDFDFHIVNFPFLSSNIPPGPFYGVYISQLIRYARCCSHYEDFRYCHKCLVDRLLSQGYRALRLKGRYSIDNTKL